MALAQGDATAGAQLFTKNKCGNCHGKTGRGDGSVAKNQKLTLLDWTDATAMADLTDAYMTEMIAKGGKAIGKSSRMPRYGHKLNAVEIQHLVAYTRSLAPQNALATATPATPAVALQAAIEPKSTPLALDPKTKPPESEAAPEPLPPADSEMGAQLFADFKCAKCHGKSGQGNGPLAKRLKLTLQDWTDAAAMAQMTDDYMAEMITHGGKRLGKSKWMPLYRHKLDAAAIQHLVAYSRSLAPPDIAHKKQNQKLVFPKN
ncbi:MAG: c-type cytochrome [Candidatus Tectomicrobia bacterium]|nr:c-type cytochrome [Candidatus Tectomicrobia bacterium]